MNDCHCREYKILKAHWRLFHKDSADLEAARSVYLRGVNEIHAATECPWPDCQKSPAVWKGLRCVSGCIQCTEGKNRERLIDVLENYRRSGQNMDTAISTLKKNMTAVLNSVEYDFSNGPVEGINRRIKSLKRSCFGFRNLDNFRKRIALIRSWRWKCFWDSLSEYTSSSRSFRRVRIVMSTATGQSRGARDRGRSAFELCESTAGIHTWIHASGNAGGVDT